MFLLCIIISTTLSTEILDLASPETLNGILKSHEKYFEPRNNEIAGIEGNDYYENGADYRWGFRPFIRPIRPWGRPRPRPGPWPRPRPRPRPPVRRQTTTMSPPAQTSSPVDDQPQYGSNDGIANEYPDNIDYPAVQDPQYIDSNPEAELNDYFGRRRPRPCRGARCRPSRPIRPPRPPPFRPFPKPSGGGGSSINIHFNPTIDTSISQATDNQNPYVQDQDQNVQYPNSDDQYPDVQYPSSNVQDPISDDQYPNDEYQYPVENDDYAVVNQDFSYGSQGNQFSEMDYFLPLKALMLFINGL